jgi:hypothetical protein
MSPSQEPWGPPRADERGRPPRAARWGWLLCGFGACLLVGVVAVGAEVGSLGGTASGIRLPSGASSVTAEPSPPAPDVTDPLGEAGAPATTDLITWATAVPAASRPSISVPTRGSTTPTTPGTTRTTNPITVGLPGVIDPAPSTTRESSPTTKQVPTVTTSASSPPPPNNAPSSSSTSQPAITTATTMALFDPAQCANWLYFLLHWGQCRAALPPPPSTTSTTHGYDD